MADTPIVRFAPSPTGNLHIGSARTALFNFLFARHEGGVNILRIEDTDRERSRPEYENNIRDGLAWLGIEFDEMHRQSERTDVYARHLEALLASGAAYLSREESRADAGKEVEVVRLRNPGKIVTFHDAVRGDVTFDTTELGDFVIARSPRDPLYHLAVVVDDCEMQVTHVIRGEDHISNTPRQILIGEAIGAERPVYAHLPLILAPDRSKLSKRHGAVAVTDYREQGYLPGALTNYLALLGWSPGDDREIFGKGELVDLFSLDGIQKSGAIFNIDKLRWINRERLKLLSDDNFWGSIAPLLPPEIRERLSSDHAKRQGILPLIRERTTLLADAAALAREGDLDYYLDDPSPSKEGLLYNGTLPEREVSGHIIQIITLLGSVEEKNFTSEVIKERVWGYATEHGRGNVLWPLRYALSGKDKSPDPFTLSEILKKETVLRRLQNALIAIDHTYSP